MALSDQSLEKFRAIYRKEFGENITPDEAREMGEHLLTLYEAMYFR